ncbi:MAG: hypothetical protein KDJ74_15675 [Notoacmeibacter sp.]|nr:hypothetical protein [Notoacmeibacter sp.]
MNAFFKAALVAAALAVTPSATAQATNTDLAVAQELAVLKATLQELEQTANEDARYVLPLRTNAQLARLSDECLYPNDDRTPSNPICEPVNDEDLGSMAEELVAF